MSSKGLLPQVVLLATAPLTVPRTVVPPLLLLAKPQLMAKDEDVIHGEAAIG